MALTGYYRRNVLDNLQVKATYTVDSYSYKNIGFGFKYFREIQFVMADNLLEYRDLAKANSFSFQFDLILFSKTVSRPTKFVFLSLANFNDRS
jgi:hypothetical protein